MRHRNSSRFSSTTAVLAVLGGLWVWPAVSGAQLLPPLPVPAPDPWARGTLLRCADRCWAAPERS